MPNWSLRYLGLARHVASWSKDPSSKVGSVIVRPDNSIVSTGFNGFPRGVSDTPERLNNRDVKYPLVVHAEMNALSFAREDVRGYTLYCTHPPCSVCAGLIIQNGIQYVVCEEPTPAMVKRWGVSFTYMKTMFEEAMVSLDFVNPELVKSQLWYDGIDMDPKKD